MNTPAELGNTAQHYEGWVFSLFFLSGPGSHARSQNPERLPIGNLQASFASMPRLPPFPPEPRPCVPLAPKMRPIRKPQSTCFSPGRVKHHQISVPAEGGHLAPTVYTIVYGVFSCPLSLPIPLSRAPALTQPPRALFRSTPCPCPVTPNRATLHLPRNGEMPSLGRSSAWRDP